MKIHNLRLLLWKDINILAKKREYLPVYMINCHSLLSQGKPLSAGRKLHDLKVKEYKILLPLDHSYLETRNIMINFKIICLTATKFIDMHSVNVFICI